MNIASPLTVEDRILELSGSPSTWIWVSTCQERRCDCRANYILATERGRQALLEHLASIQRELPRIVRHKDQRLGVPGLFEFNLNLDSAAVYLNTDAPDPVDLTDHPKIGPIARRIDGELLDRIDDLWHRALGLPTPEQGVLTSKEIVLGESAHKGLVAWNEICPTSRLDTYVIGHCEYAVLDAYCVAPNCDCGDVVINFFTRNPKLAPDPGIVTVMASGAVTVEPYNGCSTILKKLWSAFCNRHPRYADRFARRYAIMRPARARFVEAPTTTSKVGRNEPCPCASGRKYKKCCGLRD